MTSGLDPFHSIESFTFEPDPSAVNALKTGWGWLLGEAWNPFLFSAIGDVFFEMAAGSIWWLSTATGDLEQVAQSKADFLALLETDAVDEWFLPGLVTYLHSEGKVLAKGECYSYHTLPVFAQGSFSAENMFVSNARLHFETSGEIVSQLRLLGDGSQANLVINT
jgi:hypothetical protein